MQFFVGTSGFSYKEWKGSFYPEKMRPAEMLSFYAQRFSTVEMNNTFYRMPTESVVESWAPQTPDTFRFVLKAPQSITHRKRLKDVDSETDELIRVASVLKGRLGPLLFQLPPNFKKDLSRLEPFLNSIASKVSVAFEFRHESWLDDEVFSCLRKHSCALCTADMDEAPSTDLVHTASWGYVRLRRDDYTDGQLTDWIKKLGSQKWKDVYVFFKHEDLGNGPKFAARFLELAENASG